LKPSQPGNSDGNPEIFRLDVKRVLKGDASGLVQVTNSPSGVVNGNPNLRAFKGNLLAFDSDGNLVADRCVGGPNDLGTCASNVDCGTGTCGNPEGNREVFVYVRVTDLLGGDPIRQLTDAPTGESDVGQSANFSTRSTAFSSTASLVGTNPGANADIFRVASTASSVVSITNGIAGDHAEPAQAVRSRIAFTSNGDIIGLNPDGNREVFFWTDDVPPQYTQVGSTTGCLNAAPSIDSRARYAAFHSTCNRIASLGNPDQSIFVWDDKKSRLLPLVVRGELSAASAHPQAVKYMSILTYESNLGSIVNPAVCFLNVRDFLRTLDAQP